jgi:hypothetical protein
MNRTTAPDKPRAPKPRAEIAAALFAGALTLFALADMPARAPAAVAVPAAVATEPTPAPLRSASYYPEHLAALQSLSGFHPMADEGEKPPVSHSALVALTKPAPFDPKAPRRVEAKTIIAVPPAAAQAAQQSPPAPAEPIKVFGLPLPDVGAQVNAQVTNLRDVAGRWGAAASEKVTTLWR